MVVSAIIALDIAIVVSSWGCEKVWEQKNFQTGSFLLYSAIRPYP